jgi:hypothetical protein
MTNLILSSKYFTEDIIEHCDSLKTTLVVLFSVGSVFVIGSIFVLFPLIMYVRKGKTTTMDFLLQIPMKSIKSLYRKSERYLAATNEVWK